MPKASISTVFTCGGLAISKSVDRTGDHPNVYEIALPAGKAGTLTTRTDNNTGVATLSGGHGIVTSDVVDVYWASGVRYGMDATVATNAVTVDGGAGDNLPSQDTALVVCKRVTINATIDGDNIQAIALCAEYDSTSETSVCNVEFEDSGAATIAAVELTANVPKVYDIAGGATNPFTGNVIAAAYASNGSSSNAATLKILSIEDSTP